MQEQKFFFRFLASLAKRDKEIKFQNRKG